MGLEYLSQLSIKSVLKFETCADNIRIIDSVLVTLLWTCRQYKKLPVGIMQRFCKIIPSGNFSENSSYICIALTLQDFPNCILVNTYQYSHDCVFLP